MMQKMGMKMDEVPNVTEVIIRTMSKDIVIDAPSVTMINLQGQTMYQIAGGRVSQAQPEAVSPIVSGDDDAQLVAEQTGKSLEESKKALSEAGGDLAKAILSLKEKST
jgi:nascent polypeptide-associated complex subunit alpha